MAVSTMLGLTVVLGALFFYIEEKKYEALYYKTELDKLQQQAGFGHLMQQIAIQSPNGAINTLHQSRQIQALSAEQARQLAQGQADAVEIRAEGDAKALLINAQAAADARILESTAEATALELLAAALSKNPDVLTLEYIQRLSPNIRVMLLPSDNPLLLPAPGFEELVTGSDIPTPQPAPTETSP